jgi:hypothetical protein
MNMGDPETLRTFLQYGYEKFPAGKHALIFWDHGGGPLNGVCWDTLAEGDNLTMASCATPCLRARSRRSRWNGSALTPA